MRVINFIFANLICFSILSQTDEKPEFKYELTINEECTFKLKIPNQIDIVDSLLLIEYPNLKGRKYLFYIEFYNEENYKIYFFNLTDENGEICILDKKIKIMLFKLSGEIKIDSLVCQAYPLTFFTPIIFE